MPQLLWTLPIGFMCVFFIYPLTTILGLGLAPQGQIDLAGFAEIATSSYYQSTLAFSFGQAALSTLFTLLLALPGAWIYTHYRFPGRTLFAALAGLPFILPTVVVTMAFLALIGPRGIINQALMSLFALDSPPVMLERTFTIILIAHVFYNYGVAFRILTAFWSHQSGRIEEAAQTLGIGRWQMWWRVRLPLLRPALLAATTLVFTYCFTSFGVIVILGGPRFATLEVEIYRQFTQLLNLPVAAALSLVQIGFMFLATAIYTALERATSTTIRYSPTRLKSPGSLQQRLTIWLVIASSALLLCAPLLALVLRSLTDGSGSVTLQNFHNLFTIGRGSVFNTPPITILGNSLLITAAATTVTLLLGALTAWLLNRPSRINALMDTLFMLPLAASAVVLGMGFAISLDEPPLDLRTSPLLLPFAHALVALPFVLRILSPALHRIPPELERAARSLGAGKWRVFHAIQLPLISAPLAAATLLAFTISLGEFGASLFIARPNTPTLAVAIFRLLGQPGDANYERALALSIVLLLVCVLAFAIIQHLESRNHR
jgi:thiamine transport system permease protein